MRLDLSQLRQALKHLQAEEWKAAHEIVQKDEDSALACWAHGIVHIMEGDLPNARYWYARVQRPFPHEPDAAGETGELRKQLSR